MNLNSFSNSISSTDNNPLMPILFVGHGSPMNAIEENEFSKEWQALSATLPRPTAIVSISAHWETKGTFVTLSPTPQTIHDFYGFPQALYQQRYAAKGDPQLAQEIINQLNPAVGGDSQWGLDHGTWSVLKYIYPQADIPVIQISLDHDLSPQQHMELARQLAFLRTKGVLVLGSGNMIHNLRMVNVKGGDFNAEHGYDWAFELNDVFKTKLLNRDIQPLVNFSSLHPDIKLAIPTAEHYLPMLYILGMMQPNEKISLFNDKVIAGSLSMTSFLINDYT